MSSVQTNVTETTTETSSRSRNVLRKIASWICVWEIYPILGIAAFLRFYQITTTEFDEDQAMVFRMAHDAIYHGLIPATSNIASIRIVNPPAVTYLLMIPAAFSANPLWGAVFVGLFNVIAVLLTYIFVRRYFERIAAIIASLLYATAAQPLHFSRFIWQQNMVAPFVVLFIFALFWGVVDRRKGWLFPALVLLGILVQLHETTIILSLVLLAALILAPKTVRLRDLVLGFVTLLLLFSTYLLWEFYAKFADFGTLLQVSKIAAHFDMTALNFYSSFLNPYDHIPTDTHTIEYELLPFLEWLQPGMIILVIGGFITTIVGVIFANTDIAVYLPLSGEVSRNERGHPAPRQGTSSPAPLKTVNTKVILHSPDLKNGRGANERNSTSGFSFWSTFQSLHMLWLKFRATPERCGYLILLIWQIVPILVLSRHSVPVFPYYLLMVIPGPFILSGLFLSALVGWLKKRGHLWIVPGYCIYAFILLVIGAQFLGSGATLVDEASSINLHSYSYNTLNSLQDALTASDQLAMQHKFNHVYVTTDVYTQVSLRYLAEQMRTPTTLFDASRCLVLPNPADGPAVLLVGPYDKLPRILLSHFAIATLFSQPERLGGAPFQLYIVQSVVTSQSIPPQDAFVHHLQLINKQAQEIRVDNSTLLATHWSYLHSVTPDYRTTYMYSMKARLQGKTSITSNCVSTSIRAGDQLIVTFPLLQKMNVSSSITISAVSLITEPLNVSYGPFHLENSINKNTRPLLLLTTKGIPSISLSTSRKTLE